MYFTVHAAFVLIQLMMMMMMSSNSLCSCTVSDANTRHDVVLLLHRGRCLSLWHLRWHLQPRRRPSPSQEHVSGSLTLIFIYQLTSFLSTAYRTLSSLSAFIIYTFPDSTGSNAWRLMIILACICST